MNANAKAVMWMVLGALWLALGCTNDAERDAGPRVDAGLESDAGGSPLDSGGGSTDAGTPTRSCESICASRSTECGAPPVSCAQLCALVPASEVACLETASCQALEAAFERGESLCAGGGACPGAVRRCEGGEVRYCQGDIEVTERCSGDQRCDGGECVSTMMCRPLDDTGCSAVDPGRACCDGLVCFSGEAGADARRCCHPLDAPCENDDACCFIAICRSGVCVNP
ncbi:MAG: hypothetical protein AB8I08_35635 [Sandaracinaceae bacterium]